MDSKNFDIDEFIRNIERSNYTREQVRRENTNRRLCKIREIEEKNEPLIIGGMKECVRLLKMSKDHIRLAQKAFPMSISMEEIDSAISAVEQLIINKCLFLDDVSVPDDIVGSERGINNSIARFSEKVKIDGSYSDPFFDSHDCSQSKYGNIHCEIIHLEREYDWEIAELRKRTYIADLSFHHAKIIADKERIGRKESITMIDLIFTIAKERFMKLVEESNKLKEIKTKIEKLCNQ